VLVVLGKGECSEGRVGIVPVIVLLPNVPKSIAEKVPLLMSTCKRTTSPFNRVETIQISYIMLMLNELLDYYQNMS
jgi:hypothetical protein